MPEIPSEVETAIGTELTSVAMSMSMATDKGYKIHQEDWELEPKDENEIPPPVKLQ